MKLNRNQIKQAIIWACEQEVKAPKPGNVNCFSDGHNMEINDFLKSAHAIAEPLTDPTLNVGEKIHQAVKATRKVVDCNTNLGIVLLFSPICKAMEICNAEDLSIALKKVLADLTVDDAIECYKGIQLAEAGGMGKSEQEDINSTPTVTLKQAMKIAQNRDSIALQYCNNYQQIFELGLKNLTSEINSGKTVEWAIALAYLTILTNLPDTLIIRKNGLGQAQAVSKKAGLLLNKMKKLNRLESFIEDAIAWDRELKSQAINPGTSADMIAATLLLHRFQNLLAQHRISVP
jgi:triphosphoribosyl-dephospho-CoA synthase